MELNEGMTTLSFTLESLCAVKAVSCILQACRSPGSVQMTQEDVEAANDRIGRILLPPCVRDLLENLMKPIGDELNRWARFDQLASYRFAPKWTPYGTLDLVNSIMPILDEQSMSEEVRLALAREICSQKHIFDIIERMGSEDSTLLEVNFPASSFWRRAYISRDEPMRQSMIHQNFQFALIQSNEHEVSYFIDIASPEVLRNSVEFAIHVAINSSKQRFPVLTPRTYCRLFSKLSKYQKRCHAKPFATAVLVALLEWPHQQRFLESARVLIPFLDALGYFGVMVKIATRAVCGYRDCDYRAFYFEFWKLGDVRRRCENGSSMLTWPLQNHILYYLVNVGKHFQSFMLNGLPAELREAVLEKISKMFEYTTRMRVIPISMMDI